MCTVQEGESGLRIRRLFTSYLILSQLPGQRSPLYKLHREASYRLRTFCSPADLISWRYPAPPRLTLNLTGEVKCQVNGHVCVSCPGRLAIVWDHFGTRAEVTLGRYPVLRRLVLAFIWKVKCQTEGHGCVSCSGRLANVLHIFGTPADVILGRYPVLRRLTLNLTWKVKCRVKGHRCVRCKLWSRF